MADRAGRLIDDAQMRRRISWLHTYLCDLTEGQVTLSSHEQINVSQ